MYPEKKKDMCSPMFIKALFIVSKTWKKPKCPSSNEWIEKMWYLYTVEYYTGIKKSGIMPYIATWMDSKIIILSELNQTEKDKYYMISLIRGI